MKCLILGGGGFIGHHLARKLQNEGNDVHIGDIGWWLDENHDYKVFIGDLTDVSTFDQFDTDYDEIYQLAADMGGCEYIFVKHNDLKIMLNSLQINMNLLNWISKHRKMNRIFFSSSACVYNENNQLSIQNIDTREASAYPAQPDSDYGWEKLTSEKLYLAAARNTGLITRIGRYHNVYGPESDFEGVRAKSVAALARKVILADNEVEIFGTGDQVRTFLHIDDCVDATIKVMRSGYKEPLNIGSEQLVSINELVDYFITLKNTRIRKKYVPGPTGVHARTSNNDLIKHHLEWEPKVTLAKGLKETYEWIKEQLSSQAEA